MTEGQTRRLTRSHRGKTRTARAQMATRLVAPFALGLALTVSLFGAEPVAEKGRKRTYEVSTTEHVSFAPGGTIRINSSYGYLSVDGWDTPEVAITVIKSTDEFYAPEKQPQVDERFGQIKVVTERPSDGGLTISTILPHRSRWKPPFESKTAEGVTVEYRIRVPRNTHLLVHHDHGYVWVSDVTGDLEVRSHTGDMIVMLPDPGPYSINARTAIGRVSSDYVGTARYPLLFGARLRDTGTEARRVYLRIGRGSITIKKGPPYAPFGKD